MVANPSNLSSENQQKKEKMRREWMWRVISDFAPEDCFWKLGPKGWMLYDQDGEFQGRFFSENEEEGKIVLKDTNKSVFSFAEWISYCTGKTLQRSEEEIQECFERDSAKILEFENRSVYQTPWGDIRDQPEERVFMGPLRTGANIIYGEYANQIISLLLREARNRNYVIAEIDVSARNFDISAFNFLHGRKGIMIAKRGNAKLYSRYWWHYTVKKVFNPLKEAGWVIILRGSERRNYIPFGVSSDHMRGDPSAFSFCTLIHSYYFREEEAKSELLFFDEPISVPKKANVEEEITVSETETEPAKNSAIEEIEKQQEQVESNEEFHIENAEPAPCCDTKPIPKTSTIRFQVKKAAMIVSRDKVKSKNEICVTNKSTHEILSDVWDILSQRKVIAYDSGALWVKTKDNKWVKAEENIKFLRWRIANDIEWVCYDANTKSKKPHYALLGLAELMLVDSRKDLVDLALTDNMHVKKISDMVPLVGRVVALDIETSGPGEDGALDPKKNFIELLQINDGYSTQLLTTRGCNANEIAEGIRKIFDHANIIIGHNLLLDLASIWAKTRLLPKAVFDTYIAAMLLRISRRKASNGKLAKGLGLGDVLRDYLGIKISKDQQCSDWAGAWTDAQLEYAINDVRFLHALMRKQVEELNLLDNSAQENEIGLRNRVAQLEMDMLLVMIEPVVCGIPVNREEVERQIQVAQEKEMRAKAEFYRKCPKVNNINASVQVQKVFKEEGISLPDLELETLYQNAWHPVVQVYAAYKASSQIYRDLKRYCVDMLYPKWHIIGSGSGRMSSSGPNVQNIPKALKSSFYSPSITIVKGNYPAIELRLAAVYAGEQNLVDAFDSGQDIHKVTAAKVLGKSIDEIQPGERQLAKALNYGLLYGVEAARFATLANAEYGLSISVDDAEEFREKFFEAYPALRAWHQKTAISLRDGQGMITKTILGRVMMQDENDFTDALSYPIQGSCADLLKLAAVNVWRALQTEEYRGKARILNLTHDEIIAAVFDEYVQTQVAKIVQTSMEFAAQYIMPNARTTVEVQIINAEHDLFSFENCSLIK